MAAYALLDYNPYIQRLCPNENSVATLIIPNVTAANDPFVVSTIEHAEGIIWIAEATSPTTSRTGRARRCRAL